MKLSILFSIPLSQTPPNIKLIFAFEIWEFGNLGAYETPCLYFCTQNIKKRPKVLGIWNFSTISCSVYLYEKQ